MTKDQLIRNICVMGNGEIDLFLGAGASVGSGLPTGNTLTWLFKKIMYCEENNVSPEKYKDVYLPSTQTILQKYFDDKGTFPPLNSPEEYSHYFKECFPIPLARKAFIEEQVSNKNPSLGYLCLADLICTDKIKNIWTTNFDSLSETAVNIIDPLKDILVCSSANKDSISNFNANTPCICKLHGDFKYDTLQNTSEELQNLENELQNYWLKSMDNQGLVVIGYSGNDDSIMSFLSDNICNKSFISKGLFWTILKGTRPSEKVKELVEKAKKAGKIAEIVEIDGFDDFLYSVYKQNGNSNPMIDDQWRTQLHRKKTFVFKQDQQSSFLKLNTYVATDYPKCNKFDTDISSWRELKEITKDKHMTAALYKSCVYSFDTEDDLKNIFTTHIKSEITETEIETDMLKKSDSFYVGLIYKMIEDFVKSKGLVNYKRNKYYDRSSERTYGGFKVYNALEISIDYVCPRLYLCLLPTVHVVSKNGKRLDRQVYQSQINKLTSNIYNKEYNENLKKWEKLFLKDGNLLFSYKNCILKFAVPAVSAGGIKTRGEWTQLPVYTYEEPNMCFSDIDAKKICKNQIKGLVKYGPLDCSYAKDGTNRSPIKLAVLSPKECINDILSHLNNLNHKFQPKSDKFLQNYEGFYDIYKRPIIIPHESDKTLCPTYPLHHFDTKSPSEFVDFIRKGIAYFSNKRFEYDVLVIYIPKIYERFRESSEISEDFNLHDAIKLYAAEKGVTVQFIEERSLKTYDLCKVMWGLSTSLYTKSQGVLWHPETIESNTVFVGIGYAQSRARGICVGCSQLFDSTGTGVRMILRKINNPLFDKKKSPYMDKDESRTMMTKLKEQYYHCCPTAKINRIVIHKTTPFMKEEIIGITQAFEGVDVELLQIQEYSPWRAIRFGMEPGKTAEGFAIKRGTGIILNDEKLLLWTHGCVQSEELSGANRNYYKNGRGIPTPLLITRHYGQSDTNTLIMEILLLTKMNWNSGDSLYKALPVTLDFAKVLSRMSKQEEAIYDKAYDFRYFM